MNGKLLCIYSAFIEYLALTCTTETAAAAQDSYDYDHQNYRAQHSDNYTHNRCKEVSNTIQGILDIIPKVIESAIIVILHTILEVFIVLMVK